MSCKEIDIENMSKGWACCQEGCRTFNSDMRTKCKHCQHERCGEAPEVKEIVYRKDDKVMLQRVKVEGEKSKLN